MTLLDSIDSILMLYSYTGFAEHRFHLFEPVLENDARDHKSSVYREAAATSVTPAQLPRSEGPSHENETEPCPPSAALSEEQPGQNGSSQGNIEQPVGVQLEDRDAKIRDIRKEAQRELRVKRNMMSGLSILLTLMSIVVAFRYEFPLQPTSNQPDRRASLCQYITNHDYGIDRGQLRHVQCGGKK
jgi:high-affinity nickel-transport protein